MRFIKIASILSAGIISLIYGWNNIYVSEQKRIVDSFNSLYTSGPINVYIKQDQSESVVVRADNNILDKVIVEVKDRTLNIYTIGDIRHERVLDVYINYKLMDSIHTSGPSTLTSRSILRGDNLKIMASVSAEVKLQTQVDTLNLIMNDAANVQLAGSSAYLNILITDVGDLMAYNLESQHCKVVVDAERKQNPGIGRIRVTDTLDVIINGSRHVKYIGNPIISQKLIRGDGRLIRY